jgi:hypothetical protein
LSPAIVRRRFDWQSGEHLERGGPLGVAVSGGELGVDDQRGAVLDQQMPRVAQRRRGVVGLAIQPASGSVVEAWVSFDRFSPCQLDLDVAASGRLRRRTVFGLEALVRRPRVQQVPSTEK